MVENGRQVHVKSNICMKIRYVLGSCLTLKDHGLQRYVKGIQKDLVFTFCTRLEGRNGKLYKLYQLDIVFLHNIHKNYNNSRYDPLSHASTHSLYYYKGHVHGKGSTSVQPSTKQDQR